MYTPRITQISFKQQEYPFLIQQQHDLQMVYRLGISSLYKYLLREKHQELFGVPPLPREGSLQVPLEGLR